MLLVLWPAFFVGPPDEIRAFIVEPNAGIIRSYCLLPRYPFGV